MHQLRRPHVRNTFPSIPSQRVIEASHRHGFRPGLYKDDACTLLFIRDDTQFPLLGALFDIDLLRRLRRPI